MSTTTQFGTTPEERLGDIIEYMDSYGHWHWRYLRRDKLGFYVNFNGERVSVKQHDMFSLGANFRKDKEEDAKRRA